MMFKPLIVYITLTVYCSGRQFRNPVVNIDTPDPGVVFYDGLYYAVTTGGSETKKYPIHVSKDLQYWEWATYVFLENNHPVWSADRDYWAPEIHVLGDGQFRVYFTTRDASSNRLAIGGAFSTNILGPYHALDRPLVLDLTQDILDATLINDNGTLNLVWKGSEFMYGRMMHKDGLSFSPDSTTIPFMRNDLPWESYIIEGPWIIKRNNTFYMFYSGNEYCGDKYAVGVARSKFALGPYEKRGDPILTSNDALKGPGHCSVVRDTDGVSDVMVFHAYKAGEVCTPYPRLMSVQSMGWGSDGWPYMTD